MSNSERALRLRLMAIRNRVEQTCRGDFGWSWFGLKKEDELRLLRLGQWEEHYRVPLSWILRRLVPYWKNRYGKYQKDGFGCHMSTLTGKKSEEVLRQMIQEAFPDGENETRWRAWEQERQWRLTWDAQPPRLDWDHPRETIQRYQRRVQSERKERLKFARQMKRRPYRNNPWL